MIASRSTFPAVHLVTPWPYAPNFLCPHLLPTLLSFLLSPPQIKQKIQERQRSQAPSHVVEDDSNAQRGNSNVQRGVQLYCEINCVSGTVCTRNLPACIRFRKESCYAIGMACPVLTYNLAIELRVRYGMSWTDLSCYASATRCPGHTTPKTDRVRYQYYAIIWSYAVTALWAYALSMRCPVLTQKTLRCIALRAIVDVQYCRRRSFHTVLPTQYAMSGTEPAYRVRICSASNPTLRNQMQKSAFLKTTSSPPPPRPDLLPPPPPPPPPSSLAWHHPPRPPPPLPPPSGRGQRWLCCELQVLAVWRRDEVEWCVAVCVCLCERGREERKERESAREREKKKTETETETQMQIQTHICRRRVEEGRSGTGCVCLCERGREGRRDRQTD
eukprot:2276839-Rhodomonas_salina.1